jgi:class 3 adenylate cyclase
MSSEEGRRKLAAILAADVAGYSRLMAADDRATVAALKQAREVFRVGIEARSGRLIDTAGDSVLAEFPSVVEAVECAVAVQERLAEINAPLPEDRRMLFRIGVNQGDVIEEADGTVYGGGVNVAARLEGLTEPGTIAVSARVYDDVEDRLDIGFVDIGEHEVKNIAKPVRAYRVLPERAPQPVSQNSVPVTELMVVILTNILAKVR